MSRRADGDSDFSSRDGRCAQNKIGWLLMPRRLQVSCLKVETGKYWVQDMDASWPGQGVIWPLSIVSSNI